MRNILLLALLFSAPVFAQQLTYRLPRDAANAPLYSGVGNPYAFELTATLATYDVGVRYQLPSTGIDTNRVYRHLYVLNRSGVRTVYVCFGGSTGCTTDSYIVRPEYGLVFEPIRFGKAVDLEYVYIRLDIAGSAAVDLSAW